jgi:hypothetical protein
VNLGEILTKSSLQILAHVMPEVTYLLASDVPLLTVSILACPANGFGQLVPTGFLPAHT